MESAATRMRWLMSQCSDEKTALGPLCCLCYDPTQGAFPSAHHTQSLNLPHLDVAQDRDDSGILLVSKPADEPVRSAGRMKSLMGTAHVRTSSRCGLIEVQEARRS
jgi:hypothetical protein